MTPAVTEEGKLIDDVTGPPNGPGDYDIYMWGWTGDPDPNSLLTFFQTSEIGSSSDSYYSNPHYDELYTQQKAESDPAKRKTILAEMQNLVYDEAPYIILYYDAELHAYRTDKFGGWTNQPKDGTPLFGYGSGGYNAPDRRVGHAVRPAIGRGAVRGLVRRRGGDAGAVELGRQHVVGQLVDAAARARHRGARRDHRRGPDRHARPARIGRGGMTQAGGTPPVDPAPATRPGEDR